MSVPTRRGRARDVLGRLRGDGEGPGLASPLQPPKELALVGLVAVIQLGATVAAAHNQPEHGGVEAIGLRGAALLILGVAAVPWRHRFPVGVLAFTFLTTLTYLSVGDPPGGPVFASLVVALIHVVLLGRRWVAVAFLAGGWVLFPSLGGDAGRPSLAAQVGLAAWLVALLSVTEVARSRRERSREAARSAAEALRRQAADERVRMAREIHDSVAHNMSLVSIQAGVALHLLEEGRGDPEQAKRSLATIKEASREALVELRSILGVLRHGDEVDTVSAGAGAPDAPDAPDAGSGAAAGAASAPGSAGDGGDAATAPAAPRAPVPGLARLDSLVERAASAGLEARVRITVEPDRLAGLTRSVDVAAFRIVQESLTNVSRHSDATVADVAIGERDGMLTVTVADEGSGGPGPSELPGGGNGVVGMRERAAAVGGRLTAGPRPGQGFAVRAELPLEVGRAHDEPGEAT